MLKGSTCRAHLAPSFIKAGKRNKSGQGGSNSFGQPRERHASRRIDGQFLTLSFAGE